MNNELLRRIPKVDVLLGSETCRGLAGEYGRNAVATAVRHVVDSLREAVIAGKATEIPTREIIEDRVRTEILTADIASLRPVVNATGVVLHTNLGRAVMSERAARAAYEVAREYSNLEYNLETGARSSRYTHVEPLLCRLCGCEAAMAVNNNAAAVMLVLNTMASGKEAVISRGELVEIGGSFRIPEIMKISGVTLAEVGTTNKTALSDYRNAVTENTAVLLKVHTSNFRIEGFVHSVPIEELTGLGAELNLPVVYDMGSGALFHADDYGLFSEPEVTSAVASGADVICFSGDKLLGGPQAGIILGKKKFIEKMKKNQLTRAFRLDKMTLAALQATLRAYLEPETLTREIPTLAMLSAPKERIAGEAELLCEKLCRIPGVKASVVPEQSAVGGGSLPGQILPTSCVAAECAGYSADGLALALRMTRKPVIGRINRGRFLLDMRTVRHEDINNIADAFAGLAAGKSQ